MKIKFLQKPIASFPTIWTIATSAEEFEAIQKRHVDFGYHDKWEVSDTFDGITHFFDRVVVVCLPLNTKPSVIVHEAVHVFKAMMRDAGEENPGEEVEAYCIQFIFEQMMAELQARNFNLLNKAVAKEDANEAK